MNLLTDLEYSIWYHALSATVYRLSAVCQTLLLVQVTVVNQPHSPHSGAYHRGACLKLGS